MTGPVDIRPARDSEAASCRALLAEAFPLEGWPPQLFVALAGQDMLGAAAVTWRSRGFPVLIRVRRDERRRGIGRALLHAVTAAVTGETAWLRAWAPLSADGPAAAFLLAQGFTIIRRLLRFETDAVQFEQAMTKLLRRIERRVPEDIALVPLRCALHDAIGRLVAPEFDALPHDIGSRLPAGSPRGFDQDLSLVLVRGDEPVAAILSVRTGSMLTIDVNVVAPGLRGGWANPMLLEGTARLSRSAGIDRFRFSCEPHVRDTINLARRSGARSLPEQLVLALRLEGCFSRLT